MERSTSWSNHTARSQLPAGLHASPMIEIRGGAARYAESAASCSLERTSWSNPHSRQRDEGGHNCQQAWFFTYREKGLKYVIQAEHPCVVQCPSGPDKVRSVEGAVFISFSQCPPTQFIHLQSAQIPRPTMTIQMTQAYHRNDTRAPLVLAPITS